MKTGRRFACASGITKRPASEQAAMSVVRTAGLTVVAMLAFAGNSLICRFALASDAIDAASFTALRIAAGAALLAVVIRARDRQPRDGRGAGGWKSALALFAYAALFSYAYLELDAATGALLLFGLVQASMITAALFAGDRPSAAEWIGWFAAAGGLGWLLLPGAGAPSAAGALAMGLAGVAWGIYSLLGRRERDATAATARNFGLAVIPAALLAALTLRHASVSPTGASLAILSGAITSGLGYVAWYAALAGLSSVQAAMVQLSVPAIAAVGGVLLLAEPASARLLASGALILGGIALAIAGRGRYAAGTGHRR